MEHGLSSDRGAMMQQLLLPLGWVCSSVGRGSGFPASTDSGFVMSWAVGWGGVGWSGGVCLEDQHPSAGKEDQKLEARQGF